MQGLTAVNHAERSSTYAVVRAEFEKNMVALINGLYSLLWHGLNADNHLYALFGKFLLVYCDVVIYYHLLSGFTLLLCQKC